MLLGGKTKHVPIGELTPQTIARLRTGRTTFIVYRSSLAYPFGAVGLYNIWNI
jgi:hypothetical protein